jgi:hypothetical protein
MTGYVKAVEIWTRLMGFTSCFLPNDKECGVYGEDLVYRGMLN